MNVIELKNITKIYRMGEVDVVALDSVSLSISEGEFVAIMGHSGSGKSTLLNLIGLLDKPTSGSYKLVGSEISMLSDDQLASLRNEFLGFVFQSFNLLPRTSSLENVALPLVYSDKKKNDSEIIDLLKKVGLGDRAHHKPNELSGGQQQRVAIARALVNSPLLMFADEPTGNLDSKSAEEIINIFKELNKSGITIVMVTHEPDLASVASRTIKLHDGKIVSDENIGGSSSGMGLVDKLSMEKKFHKYDMFRIRRVKEYFAQAFRALISNKARTFLSILGVLIGVTCLITMLALGRGAQKDVEKNISSMGSNLLMVMPSRFTRGGVSTQAPTRFIMDDCEQIAQIPNVSGVVPYCSGNGQVVYKNKNWNSRITGTSIEYEKIKSAQPVKGTFFTQEDVTSRKKVAIIGKTVLKNLFGDQDPLGEFIKINRIDFQVIGVLPEKGSSGWRDEDDAIIIPLNTAMYRLFGREYIDNMDVQVDNPQMMDRVVERIRKMIIALHRIPPDKEDSFDIRNMAELQQTITSTIKTFSLLLGAIAFISLLVGGIGIMNIMLVSVTERTREIGLRKSIGANNSDILFQFMIESVIICVLGGVIGILFGSFISFMFAKFAHWSTYVTPGPIILAFTFSFFVGLIFGLWPARKASLLNPIDALRYE